MRSQVQVLLAPQASRGDVAQLGERLVCTEEVRGSSPLVSTSRQQQIDRLVPIGSILILAILHAVVIIASPLKASIDTHIFDAAANRILAGDVPYIDFYMVALPAIQYLHVPAAALGQLLGINGASVWLVLTWLQLAACLVICCRLANAAFDQETSPCYRLLIPLLLAGLSFSLLLTHDFGQREHFFLIYATPWLLMRFCAWEGKRFRSPAVVIFGALVGIATAAKPYYYVIVGGIELYCLLRYRRLRPLQSNEFLGFVSASLIYLGLIVASPEVFQGVRLSIEQSVAYYHIREPSAPDETIRLIFLLPLSIGALTLCFSLIGGRKVYRFLGVLGSFTIGGAAIVVLQPGSDLYRHFILLGGAVYCAGHLLLLPAWKRRPRGGEPFAGYAIYAFFVFFACINVLVYWHRLHRITVKTDRDLRHLVEVNTQPGDDVLFMSGQVSNAFPWLGRQGLNPVSSAADSWVLPLDEETELALQTLALYASLTRRDIEASPAVIIVDKKPLATARVPEFLERYDLFEDIHRRYTLLGETNRFDAYKYVGDPPPKATLFEFNERFTLYSWQLEAGAACETLELRTWWRPGIAADLEAYTLHVDLVSKETGVPLVESFGRIGAVEVYSGRSSLLDAQQLALPCDEANGTMMLLLSLEDMSAVGGSLLSVRDSRGADYGKYAFLGEITLNSDDGD